MDILLGLPGQIKKLLDRMTNSTVPLSDTRVGYLDASIAARASQSSVDTVDTNVDSILATVTANLDAPVSQAGLPVQQAFSHSGWTMAPSTTLAGPKTAAGTTWLMMPWRSRRAAVIGRLVKSSSFAMWGGAALRKVSRPVAL